MAQDALNAQRAEFDQGAAEHRIYEEDVSGAVGGEAARQILRAGHRFGV